VKKLLSEFSGNRYKPRAIHNTAWEYRKAGRYDKADQLYQYVVDNQSGNEDMMWVKTGIARLNIALGNDAAVEKTIDILIADFNDHPELPTAIFMLGEEYYNKAFQYENQGQEAEAKEHFRKAISVLKRIIQELPASDTTPQGYCSVALCYYHLAEYEKAIDYCKKTVDNWPHYNYAWYAQFLIADCYEKLANSGRIPTADAAAQIRQACERLANHSDPRAVEAARNLSKRWNFNQNQE